MSTLTWLDEDTLWFPDLKCALTEPDGLLAVGGDLSADRLLLAYRHGIFPWFEEGQPILWWAPDPRSVLFPEKFHISRSLQKTLNKQSFQITFDTCFEQVIASCAQPRRQAIGTWITNSMCNAYTELHRRGFAHSVEVWQSGKLVGGLYGIAMGKVFFGESMFSIVTDASKVGFARFVIQARQWGFRLLDCQVQSGHLDRFGAELVDRNTFAGYLKDWVNCNPCWDS